MTVSKIWKQEKELNYLGKRKTMSDGYKNDCKQCEAEDSTKRQRTKFGIFARLYSHQCEASRKRGHEKPQYTWNELRSNFIDTPLFNKIYDEWVKSNFLKEKAPSFDRIDNSKGYSFDNIRLTTWKENDILGSQYLKLNPNKGCFKKGNIPWNKKW